MKHIVKTVNLISMKSNPDSEKDDPITTVYTPESQNLVNFKEFYRFIKQAASTVAEIKIVKVTTRPELSIQSLADDIEPLKARKSFLALDCVPERLSRDYPVIGLDEDHAVFAERYAKFKAAAKITEQKEDKKLREDLDRLLFEELNLILRENGKDRMTWYDFIDLPFEQVSHLLGELMNNIIQDFSPDNVKNKTFRSAGVAEWFVVKRIKENDMDKVRTDITTLSGQMTGATIKGDVSVNDFLFYCVVAGNAGWFNPIKCMNAKQLYECVKSGNFRRFATQEEYISDVKRFGTIKMYTAEQNKLSASWGK